MTPSHSSLMSTHIPPLGTPQRSGLAILWRRGLFLAMVVLFLSGCVIESKVNNERVFQYEWWAPAGVLLGGVVAGIGGWFWRSTNQYGWALLIIGPLFALFLAPSLAMEFCRVRPDGFHLRTGIWGSAEHKVELANVRMIRLTSEKSTSRRGTRTNYFLNFEMKTGPTAKVPVNNAIMEAAAPVIMEHVNAHNITIRNEIKDE